MSSVQAKRRLRSLLADLLSSHGRAAAETGEHPIPGGVLEWQISDADNAFISINTPSNGDFEVMQRAWTDGFGAIADVVRFLERIEEGEVSVWVRREHRLGSLPDSLAQVQAIKDLRAIAKMPEVAPVQTAEAETSAPAST